MRTTAPPRPWRISPLNGFETDDPTPSFDWSDVCAPAEVSYCLQIDNDSNFSSPWLSMQGLRNSEYTLTGGEALADGDYYWRVCALDGVGRQSDWTSGWALAVSTT